MNDTRKWWDQAAWALPSDEFKATVPLYVLLGEAVDIAAFGVKYWEPKKHAKTGKVLRPGLASAGKNLPKRTVEEIRELQRAAQDAQSEYLLLVDPQASPDLLPRARFVLGELTASLEWFFDDGVADEKDAQLERVASAHQGDPDTADALAGELVDYAALARSHRKELQGLGGFDAALIDEAPKLAVQLRERPPAPVPPSAEEQRALAFRNRLLTLLQARIGRVRAAARFVFRNHPAIIREATSAYERRRRAAARRAAARVSTPSESTTSPR
ncbi:MAG: hypothetical protein HY906_20390 [Deltaproteobacteria bacterium]|nr:hypothetical protein [Deltaproteobacteria bacterium]